MRKWRSTGRRGSNSAKVHHFFHCPRSSAVPLQPFADPGRFFGSDVPDEHCQCGCAIRLEPWTPTKHLCQVPRLSAVAVERRGFSIFVAVGRKESIEGTTPLRKCRSASPWSILSFTSFSTRPGPGWRVLACVCENLPGVVRSQVSSSSVESGKTVAQTVVHSLSTPWEDLSPLSAATHLTLFFPG